MATAASSTARCPRHVQDWYLSRTTIDIDDELVATVMRRFRLRAKKQAVDLALRTQTPVAHRDADHTYMDAVTGPEVVDLR